MKNRFFWPGAAIAGLASLFSSLPAYAHHAMDGSLPRNWMEGFISGLAYPIIGLDHLAMIVAVGGLALLTLCSQLTAWTKFVSFTREFKIMKNHFFWPGAAIVGLASFFSSLPAYAHHVMDGSLPRNWMEGFISGLAHPVIGLDHLAMVVAVGLLAGLTRLIVIVPATFSLAAIVGVGLHLQSFDIPFAEAAIALSVISAGLAIILPRRASVYYLALFFVGGILHGYAYGEAVVGAYQAAILAYLLGFALIQTVLAMSVAFVTRAVNQGSFAAVSTRLSGAAILGVGITFFHAQIMPF